MSFSAAELFLQELYTVMAYLKLLTGGLGEASFRCNAYTSLAEYPNEPEYTVKLRNLNSFNFVRKAVNSEISRQENLLAAGTKLESESRLWIEETSTTKALHERALPKKQFEKLNPTVFVDLSNSGGGTIEMELPSARRERFQKEYGLSRLRAQFLCSEKDRADYFETAVRDGAEPLLAARWMAGELMGLLNQRRTPIKQSKVTAENFAQIIKLMSQGKIHNAEFTVCITIVINKNTKIKIFIDILLSSKIKSGFNFRPPKNWSRLFKKQWMKIHRASPHSKMDRWPLLNI